MIGKRGLLKTDAFQVRIALNNNILTKQLATPLGVLSQEGGYRARLEAQHSYVCYAGKPC